VKRLTLDPVTRGWAVVTSAGVVRLGLGFVASLLIARALGPANFGVYAVLAATVGIVGSLAEGGLTEAAVLEAFAATVADLDADTYLIELKAAAIDVVAEHADRLGKRVVLAANDVVADGLDEALLALAPERVAG